MSRTPTARSHLVPLSLLLIASAALAAPARAAALYHLTDLSARRNLSINNQGEVLYTRYPENWMPIMPVDYGVYRSTGAGSGTTLDLPALSRQLDRYDFIAVTDRNNSGRVAGLRHGNSGQHLVVSDGRALTEVALPGSATGSPRLNERGDVAGTYIDPTTGKRLAFLAPAGGPVQSLGALDGDQAWIHNINDLGQVVGRIDHVDGNRGWAVPFVYNPTGGTTELAVGGMRTGEATHLNEAGQVLGTMQLGASFNSHLFLADAATGLGSDITAWLAAGQSAQAVDLDAAGRVLANISTAEGDRPYLFDGVTWLDLNSAIDPSLGWTLYRATGLNDLGQIVGEGLLERDGQRYQSSFLLTPAGLSAPIAPSPVPEPATLVLFAALAALLISRRAGLAGRDLAVRRLPR